MQGKGKMKRKRECSRHNHKSSEAVGANKTLLNSASANAGIHSNSGDSGKEGFDSRMDAETTEADSTLRSQNTALHGPVFADKTNGDNQHESNLVKNVVNFAAKLSKDVGSSSVGLYTNNLPLYTDKEPRLSHQDPHHNEKELNAALLVIKKIMKMDAAEPFNVPVDPVALGIPDCFDIIDTPMDFTTICNTLELGTKYRNSKDVYKDVDLIWGNCFKYSKSSSHILDLMKQVKNNFMKHWSDAGLFREQEEINNVHLERNPLQATKYGMLQTKHGCSCRAGSLIVDSLQQGHPDITGLCYMQQKPHSPCHSHVNQPQQILSLCQCRCICTELQSSQPQNACNNCKHVCTLGPRTGNTNHQKQYQMCSGRNHRFQQSLTCAEQYQPHQKSRQCCSNLSKFRDTEPDVKCTWNTGPSLVHSLVESSMRFAKRRLDYSMAAVTSNHSRQQQCQMDPCQLQSSSIISSHSYQPQKKCCQCHPDSSPEDHSLPLDGANMGHSYMLRPTEPTARHATCRAESSVLPVADDGSHEQECQVVPGESKSPSSDNSPSHEPKSNGDPSHPRSSPPLEPSPEQVDVNHCNGDSAGLPRKTRGRGPTRCLSLLREGKRISITTNELGEPVGLEAPKLISYVGTLARDGHMAPLTYVDWRALPEANKEKMWKEVQTKFEIDRSSKTWVLKSLGKKWKDWKSKLKTAHYITHATDEERLADRDKRVLPDQWAYLVSHWSSEEAEKRSATNRANRARQKFGHVTGTKSFARIREEERAKRPDGKVPSRMELFILTRTRKDGRPVNEESSAVITQLREIASQQKDTSKSTTTTDDVFSQVVGRDSCGRVRCGGLGPSPSEFGGRKPTHAEAMEVVSEANAEVREMKERLVAMEQTCAQMAAQMAKMMSMMSSMHKSLPDENVPNLVSLVIENVII